MSGTYDLIVANQPAGVLAVSRGGPMDTSDPFLNQSEHQAAQLKRRIRFLTTAYRVSWAILIPLLIGAVVGSGPWAFLAALPITGLLCTFAALGNRARSMEKTVEKHLVRSASEVMLQDTRPPLLYLRSFSDEPTTRQISLWSPRTIAEEQLLATALTRVGPLVAIGRPGDPLPEVGANRIYVPDSEWASVLLRLMGEAAGVIIRIGPGHGLDWEIRQALHRLPPERLLIVLPRDEYTYAAFRVQFGPLIPQPLPHFRSHGGENGRTDSTSTDSSTSAATGLPHSKSFAS